MRTPMTTIFRLAALPAAIALMSACGGGGGGRDDGSPSPDGSSATSSGTAAKGIIVGGTVTALEISAGALVSRGTAQTDAEGDYDLSIAGYTGGPLVIEIRGDDDATMKCDVQAGCPVAGASDAAFGEAFPIGSTFVMRTLLPAVADGAALSRCITPFTDLATRRAQELAGGQLANVTASQATAALSEVSQLVGGVDVLRTCVVDITDPDQIEDADGVQLALSGLAAAVLATSEAGDPASALQDLAEAFGGGAILAADLDALVESAKVELAAAAPGAEINLAYANIDDSVEEAGENGTVDPQPANVANQSDIEQGKALIDEVRSLVLNVANDARESETNTAVAAFRNELRTADDVTDLQPLGDAFGVAFDAADAFYATVADGASGSTVLSTTDSNGAAQTATITVDRSGAQHTATVVGRSGDFAIDIAVSAPGNPVAGGSEPTDLAGDVEGSMTSVVVPSGRVGVKATLDGTVAADDVTYDQARDAVSLTGARLAANASIEQIGVADPFRFTGAITLDVTRCSSQACGEDLVDENGEPIDTPPLNIDLFSVDGTFANSKGSFQAQVTVDMDAEAVASFDPRRPIGAGNVPAGKVLAQFDAGLANYHDYSVAVVLELDDITDLNAGADDDLRDLDASLGASFRRDGNIITFEAQTLAPDVEANADVIDLSIKNQDGVSLLFDDLRLGERVLGTVTVGETVVGDVEETEDGVILIRWKDGSFESLG